MQVISMRAGESLLRLPEVEVRTGLGKSAIYAGMRAGTFPKCVKLGKRASAWPASAIEQWIDDCIAESRGAR